MDSMVARLRRAGANFPGYRFMVPIRASIFRDPGKEFEINIIGQDLEELHKIATAVNTQITEIKWSAKCSF